MFHEMEVEPVVTLSPKRKFSHDWSTSLHDSHCATASLLLPYTHNGSSSYHDGTGFPASPPASPDRSQLQWRHLHSAKVLPASCLSSSSSSSSSSCLLLVLLFPFSSFSINSGPDLWLILCPRIPPCSPHWEFLRPRLHLLLLPGHSSGFLPWFFLAQSSSLLFLSHCLTTKSH